MGRGDRRVRLHTSYGPVTLELFAEHAPLTVENFLGYVDDGFYNNTLFHRVIHGFLVQGGGFQAGMVQKTTRPPIPNEAAHGLRNERATVAMARLPDEPDSATSQFFINTRDNDDLDYRGPGPRDCGYCVFARVIEGMEVVDRIEGVPTASRGRHEHVPVRDVLLEWVEPLR